MHVDTILHQLLNSTIHKTRIKTLSTVVQGLLQSKKMQLTNLGRSLTTQGQERSGIRRVDRLLSNTYLQRHSIEIYRCLCAPLIQDYTRPDILVDWSSLPNSRFHNDDGESCFLRASLVAKGKCITLYEEVHLKKGDNNHAVHTQFLNNLKSLLPIHCCPCIITDAGFKNPWFQYVLSLGWNYIGRIRGLVQCDNGSGFIKIKTLFKRASASPKFLGVYCVAKTNPINTHLYLYKQRPQGRHNLLKSKRVSLDKDSIKYSKGACEPWVLVSSLKGYQCEKKVVKKYKSRMLIEEGFRDTKSTQYGLGMDRNITKRKERYIVWLILAALASLIAWMVGFAAEDNQLHRQFQANSYRHKRVLSLFFLGCQVIRRNIYLKINLSTLISTGISLERIKWC